MAQKEKNTKGRVSRYKIKRKKKRTREQGGLIQYD